MARLVVPQSAITGRLASAKSLKNLPPDDYRDRLVKYIPAESVALYVAVDKMVNSHYGLSTLTTDSVISTQAVIVSWVILALGIIGTPIYLRQRKLPGQPWVLNASISTIAFVLWAYTLSGSVFLVHGWYSVFAAGLLAPIFTFVAGFFEPRPE
ncbi:hypothetical protein [Agrobacterium tumefaciens]|uniref:hypothetical protein n=1 Tax=Agrobacterium tumefaciens TaxID=358 RepID=UPI00157451AF|nr:hypothetical protein [Agrobacterium tumefaciens]WCK05223.1 hypothetical protein G6L31_021730 [Agrobacterium tumefaciens]